MFQTTNQWKKAWNAMKCCNFGEISDQLHLTSQFLSPPYINFDPEPLQWLEINPANCGDLTNKIWRYQLQDTHVCGAIQLDLCQKSEKCGFFRSKNDPMTCRSMGLKSREISTPSPLGLQVQNSQAYAAIGSVDHWILLDMVGGWKLRRNTIWSFNIANWKPWPI